MLVLRAFRAFRFGVDAYSFIFVCIVFCNCMFCLLSFLIVCSICCNFVGMFVRFML